VSLVCYFVLFLYFLNVIVFFNFHFSELRHYVMVLEAMVQVNLVINLGLLHHVKHLRVATCRRLRELEHVLSIHDFLMDGFDLVSAEVHFHGVNLDTDSSLLLFKGCSVFRAIF